MSSIIILWVIWNYIPDVGLVNSWLQNGQMNIVYRKWGLGKQNFEGKKKLHMSTPWKNLRPLPS